MIGKGKLGWNFPANNDGQENGLNDPGIETFKDNPLSSLAREVPQNSADATDETTKKPVEVHFQSLEIPSSDFPGRADFKKVLEACRSYWTKSQQTIQFFDTALDVIGTSMLPVLRISDFNTTGVVVGKSGNRDSDWFRLTKAVGASDKSAGKLGSFGIGKHAPFACSDLRTVFYGTKDNDGVFAFQGVSKLVSHKREGQVTQGTGYYGIRHGNKPLPDFGKLSPMFERKRVGADIYVMGFHPYANWEAKIIKSVIESFFVAIHNGTLVVKVGKTTLNQLSLPENIKKHYTEPDPHFFADAYYAALVSEESVQFTEEDFLGCGAVRLRILENKEFKKKVAMFRRSGMKIFDKGHFQTPLRFAGVFTVEGPKLDSTLRALEPPSHNAWEPERSDDPEVKKLPKALYAWINDRIRELVGNEDLTEIDAEGVSQYLPDEIDDATTGTPQQIETINEEPASVLEMRIRSSARASAPTYEPDASSEERGDDDVGPDAPNPGPGPTPEADPTPGPGPGPNPPDDIPNNSGGGASKADQGQKRIDIANVRIYCTDPSAGSYRLLFEPTSGEANHLRVFVIGEVGVEPAPVKMFSVNGGPETTPEAEKGFIGPLTLPQGERATLDVVLKDSLRCALGVAAYAD